MKIDWNPGDSLSVLAALRETRLAARVANTMAKKYQGEILDFVEQGKAFTDRGKHRKYLRWRTLDGPSALVYTQAKHLYWMEEGTLPHAIAPRQRGQRQVLRFRAGGGHAFRRAVAHPGTRKLPFFFADTAARGDRMRAAGRGVLAAKLGLL